MRSAYLFKVFYLLEADKFSRSTAWIKAPEINTVLFVCFNSVVRDLSLQLPLQKQNSLLSCYRSLKELKC